MSMGGKHKIWTKELDDKLLDEISKGKNLVQLEIAMDMSHSKICNRIKEMGFDNLCDARRVMSN
jgi:hypothetical protein